MGAAGLMAVPLLSACGDEDSPADPNAAALVKQIVMAPADFSVSFLDMLVTGHQGFFAKEGINADLQSGTGSSSALQAIIGGVAHYTRAGRTALPAIINEGAPLKVIGTVQHSDIWEIGSLSKKPIAEPGALRGKRIGVASEGGATEQLVHLLAESAGVKRDEIKLVVVGAGAAGYQFMLKGDVDGWIVHNYVRKAIEEESGEKLTVLKPEDHVRLAGSSWTMASKTDIGDVPVRFLRALLNGMKFAADEKNRGAVFDALQKYNAEAKRKTFDEQFPAQLATWTANKGESGMLDLIEEDWVSTVKLMHSAGMIKRIADPKEFLDRSYIDKAKA
ncbi:ABC transporter substrate-binding protein [Dactylosporangium sp. NPDC050688]|uniref:ABC transporter substrate-binding protein n=1 Tax=Dactylosporangium sp. NPDC050688 TaxID=3157217 RepID=UPI0033E82E10